MIQLLLIWLLIFLGSWQQEDKLVLKGELFETKTRERVPYVNITAKSSGIRLISNAEGKFVLNLPAKYQNDTLLFSCIGFEPLAVPVQAFLPGKKVQRIYLHESVASLQEVRVTPLNARQIVERGIARIPDNYTGTSYQAEGFYRHAVKENGAFTNLIESVVKVTHTGFNPGTGLKVAYLKTRLSHDYRQYKPAVKPNLIQNALGLDHVRYGRGFLNQNNLGNWQFKITGYTQIDKQDIYIIKASLPNARNIAVHQATIYVRAEDYAFLKIDYDYNWKTENLKGEPFRADTIKYKKYSWKGTFSYMPYGSKMVLNYFHFTLKQQIYSQTYITVSSGRLQTTKALASQELHEEFTVNNIHFAGKGRAVANIGNFADLYQNALPYDRNFWRQYQKPVDSKLYQEVKSDLEKHAPLEEQFERGGVE